MRFECVKAYAFGPFKGETLELASGMNVVYGLNEAGKSSWHAALYAGLCGMRRRRGAPSRDDAKFAELRRPWGRDAPWEVGVIVKLEDGRRVELNHDLAGRVDSGARDVDLATRDYSSEIMHEGAPDGARWLGLDRRSFLMTACIRQADILGLQNSPSELQDELQRAADTADRDGTAVEALTRLHHFRAEFVGSPRAPTKPLRTTEGQVQRARRHLEQAQNEHEEYLLRWMNVDKLSEQARDAERRLGVARAALAAAAASEAVTRLRRAEELHARFPEGAPRRPSQDDDLVRQVASALTTWDQRPTVPELEGETIPDLEARLAEIDLHLAVNAERAARQVEERLGRAREFNARFPAGRPQRPSEDEQLERTVATALATWESRPSVHEPAGPTVVELECVLASVGTQLGEPSPSTTNEARAAGGFLAALFRAVRSLFAAVFRLFSRRTHGPSPEQRQALEERRALIRQRISDREQAEQRWTEDAQLVEDAANAIRAAAASVGFTTSDPDMAVVSLLEWQQRRTERIIEMDNHLRDWEELQHVLGGGTVEELEAMAAEGRDRAVSAAARTDAQVLAATLAASAPATSREEVSQQRRMALVHDIEERRRQEGVYAEAIASTTEAEKAVAEAAQTAGVEGEGPDELVAALRSWQDRRNVELEEVGRKLGDWEELQRILGQDSLDGLTREAKRLRTQASLLSAKAGVEDMTELPHAPTDADLSLAEDESREARTVFERQESQLEAFASDLKDVAEAQEALDAAKREYDRVRSLDRTLDLTIGFLKQAEDQIHRTIAPILAKTVREWLPKVTGGRYTDCRVDPERLVVEVATANGRWHRAELLSHGTAEQVYLLLRLALSRHLATESCPLILDDAVAASDSQRKHNLLETLLVVSESTQVILFTHEDDVCGWARARLVGDQDRLTELTMPGS